MVRTGPPEHADGAAFLSAFDAFAQAVRRARGVPGQGSADTLTLSQYALLQGLSDRGRARVVELANAAGVTAPTATRILDALERRGIVERRRMAEDRRGVTITLTPSGRELLATQDAWLRARQQAFYAELPEPERDVAADLLVRLATLIDELAAGPDAKRLNGTSSAAVSKSRRFVRRG